MKILVFLVVVLLHPVAPSSQPVTVTASVYQFPSQIYPGKYDWTVRLGTTDTEHALAYGSYDKDVDNNGGWRVLKVHAGYATGNVFTQHDLMYAAGLLEGYLTQLEIYQIYLNMFNDSLSEYTSVGLQSLQEFYAQQRGWTEQMVVQKGQTSRYWNYTGLILAQFKGLKDGYAQAAPDSEKLEDFAFDFLCGNGDFLDLKNFLVPGNKSETSSEHYGHCSVLIKVLPGYENVFASHSSWYTYASMVRIYKYYAFKLPEGMFAPPSTEVMSFSSYPGFLSSLDDFYILDSGMMMLQTTNDIFNESLYGLATPDALLAWHRVRLANWLATGGEEWAEYVSLYNSGTYNNQYMVLDLKKIKLKKDIEDGALWVIEQIPGYVESGDQTAILREGYWASYNIPFYEYIYNVSGYREEEKKKGTLVTHQLCPRAEIFRRDQGKVVDMDTMKHIMRFNNYEEDPYSLSNPMYTICSRGDLLSPPRDGGCIDTKVADYFSAFKQEAYVVNGPTNQGLPPFSWTGSGLQSNLHLGQPDTFDYSFATMTLD